MRSKPRIIRGIRGFTVLELLCAISVLTICSFGVIQLYISGFRATKEAQQELTAARLMANELEAWRIASAHGLKPEDAAPLRALTTEDRALEELASSVKVARAAEGPKGLFEVTVRLRWHGAGGRNVARETTTLVAAQEAAP